MNGPKLWSDVLSAVGVPGAVIAGGCIRDYRLNAEPKDIDVFIPVDSREAFEEACCKVSKIAGELVVLEPGEHANPPGRRYAEYDLALGEAGVLHGVAEGELLGYPVNIIGRKAHAGGVVGLVNSFDFDILQCWYDGHSIRSTYPADRAAVVRIATMAHDRHVEQSIARFMRFNGRHPGLLSLNIPYKVVSNVQE